MSSKKEKTYTSEEDLKEKANSGDVEAMELCGLLSELNLLDGDGSGLGKQKDMSKAKEWFKKAADKGSATAQLQIAKLLENDNDPESEKYFQLAENQKFIRAEKMSGYLKALQDKIDRLCARRILVVDDNQTEREMLVGLIEKRGFEVLSATHGGEALEFLNSNPIFSLLMLDINMPVMSGLDLLKEIKANPAFRGLPVIVLSGLTDKDKIIQAKQLGVSGWLLKPLEIKKLDKVLNFLQAG